MFKPNLVPNNPKDGSFDLKAKIRQRGGIINYLFFFKKDGCRIELIDKKVLSRELNVPRSILVVERFKRFSELLDECGIVLEGEFYMHGMKFNHIYRFFSKTDVTCPKYRRQLERALAKDEAAFLEKYETTDIDHLTTFHKDLKFWAFDGYLKDRPDIVRFEDRWAEIQRRLRVSGLINFESLVFSIPFKLHKLEQLDPVYEMSLKNDWEGLILVHKDHEFKNGRNTLNEGTLLKMKDDKKEYDGIVLSVEESTIVKAGVEKTQSNLGRSVTSKKKGDRLPSGMAKGYIVEFEGHTHCVSLSKASHEKRREILENADKYIGRHFVYTAMPPVKNVPRSAFFDRWRDAK